MDNKECEIGIVTEDEWSNAAAGMYTKDDPDYASLANPGKAHCNKLQTDSQVGLGRTVASQAEAPIITARLV